MFVLWVVLVNLNICFVRDVIGMGVDVVCVILVMVLRFLSIVVICFSGGE